MDFTQYQRQTVRLAEPSALAHELVPLLGIGAHVGELLHARQRYLCGELVVEASLDLLARQLGSVVRWSALLAHMSGLDLEQIARTNLIKVDRRARHLGQPGIDHLPSDLEELDCSRYQSLAIQTDQQISAGADPLSLSVPMLGLAGEAGNLLVETKKRVREDSQVADWREFTKIELGDLLWYVSTVTSHLNLKLADVLGADITRLRRSASTTEGAMGDRIIALDHRFPGRERFPRQLHLRFQERFVDHQPKVTMTLLGVSPNAFPDGPIERAPKKFQGFSIGCALGDEVDDNSRRADAYRYHDAIHLGFLAVLGWSPNLRGLLQLKRKSDQTVDDAEDGARAIFAEEGLAAILAKQALVSRHFETPSLVPEHLLDLINMVTEDLEVADLPYRLWRSAISQGFTVMRLLAEGGGGYVFADLDSRTLKYSKFPFNPVREPHVICRSYQEPT